MWILDLGWHHLVREVMEETSILEGTASCSVCITQGIQPSNLKISDGLLFPASYRF